MSDDIVTRLRNPADLTIVMWEAADEIERWRNIATQLHMWLVPDFEDDEVGKAGVYAMDMYEKAVRGE